MHPITAARSARANDWRESARCRGTDPNLFFHPDNERSAARRERFERAKKICDSCTVKWRCAEFAIESGEDYGTWGGMSEDDRAVLLAMREGGSRPAVS